MSLHQVNMLVTDHTFVAQGACLMGFLNQSILEEGERGREGEGYFQQVEKTTSLMTSAQFITRPAVN